MMQNKIVITGLMGSGKSTVARFLKKRGERVFFADEDAKNLIEGELRDEILSLSGGEDYKNIFFHDLKLKKNIEKIVYSRLYQDYASSSGGYYEIPLYFESQNIAKEQGFIPDKIIYIYTDESHRLERLKTNRNITIEDIKRRDSFFLDPAKAILLSDVIIKNNGSTKDLIEKVKLL